MENQNQVTNGDQQTTTMQLVIPTADQLGSLQSLEKGASVTVEYRTKEQWEALKGKETRAIFCGIKEVANEEGEMMVLALFQEASGFRYVSAQTILIDAVRSLPLGTPVSITYQGAKKNSKGGGTCQFEVHLLAMKGGVK